MKQIEKEMVIAELVLEEMDRQVNKIKQQDEKTFEK